MLHIILLILKIFGFLILGILAFVLLVFFVVLLSPFTYRLEASVENTRESMRGGLKFHWLFRLVSGRVSYTDGEMSWRLRIAWKSFGSGADAGKDSSGGDEKTVSWQALPEKKHAAGEETRKQEQKKREEKEKKEEERREKEPKKKPEKKKRPSLSEKLKEFWGKIKYTFQKFCDNIRTLEKKKDKLLSFIENETHHNAFLRAIKEIRRFLQSLKPRKADIWFEFGFEDPALTGYALALLSMIYPSIGEFTRLQPDFEHKVLRGKADIKGRIRAIHALVLARNMLLDKNVRATYRHIRNFKL